MSGLLVQHNAITFMKINKTHDDTGCSVEVVQMVETHSRPSDGEGLFPVAHLIGFSLALHFSSWAEILCRKAKIENSYGRIL